MAEAKQELMPSAECLLFYFGDPHWDLPCTCVYHISMGKDHSDCWKWSLRLRCELRSAWFKSTCASELTIISTVSAARQNKSSVINMYSTWQLLPQNCKRIICFSAFSVVIHGFRSLYSLCTHSCSWVLMMIAFSPPSSPAAGPCLLSGLHAFCRTELCHRARAGGRAGGRNPEAVGADAGGEARGQAAASGTKTVLAALYR